MVQSYDEKLAEIEKQIQKRIKPSIVKARTFIDWFGAQRRTPGNVWRIRRALKSHNLVTIPDFEFAFIDSSISFSLSPNITDGSQQNEYSETSKDPTVRIGSLESANKRPISVKPNDMISKAITLMITYDYSQLPVMTSEREVKGIISWTCLGTQLGLKKECKTVQDCMMPAKEINYDTYVFSAVDDIIANQYVLVRNSENIISGIVTTSDLSLQFRLLGEPFLLLGEIENYVRRILGDKFTIDDLKAACISNDTERKIEDIADLTLGEYLRLIENPQNWVKLCINVDREIFIEKLDEIRKIRNDVMHFNPEGIAEQDVEKLRDFVRLMQSLAKIGVI
jgi:predicted transcriptional regulator